MTALLTERRFYLILDFGFSILGSKPLNPR